LARLNKVDMIRYFDTRHTSSVFHRFVISGALVCGLAWSLTSAIAATHYIDFANGSDTSDGTGSATPWQHCPGDSRATGTPSSATLAADDTVIFKGGVEYKSTINLNWSGSSGHVITYDGNSGGTFGTGRAILNGENVDSDSRRYGFYCGAARSYLTFKNFEAKLFGGHASVSWTCGNQLPLVRGFGIYLTGDHLTVQDSYFHDMGDWQNQANMDGSYMEGVGVEIYSTYTEGCSNITVSNCEFTKCGRDAVQIQSLKSVTDVLVANCKIHDYVRWGVDLAGGNDPCTLNGITIDGVTFSNLYQYALNTWLGCAGKNPHQDGIIMRLANNPSVSNQTLGTVSSPIIVRNCSFYNDSATATDAGTAEIFLTTFGGRVLIYNNTFINVLSGGLGSIYAQDGVSTASNSTPVDYHIYNNTFYDKRNMVTLSTHNPAYALNLGTIRIKNNIFYKTDNGPNYAIVGLDAYSRPTEMDYNIYVTGRSDGILAAFEPSGSLVYYTLAQLRSAGSEAHGMQVDPQFVDISYGLGASSSRNDLRLKASSPAIDAGAALSSFFGTDMNGSSRTGRWAIGAFNYGTRPKYPRDLRGRLQIGN
jgi:hypothetical protein